MLPAMTASANNSAVEPVGSAPGKLTASGEKDSTNHECSLGNVVADAVRIYHGSDAAIVCGGDLTGDLPIGVITADELKSVFTKDRALATTTVTVKQLREILEIGVSHIILDESEKIDVISSSYDGFPQISGFELYYDASLLPGARVCDIRIGGESVDLDDDLRYLSLSASRYMLEGGYGLSTVYDITVSDMTLYSVTALHIENGAPGYSAAERRIHVKGISAGILEEYIPFQFLPFLVIPFFVAQISRKKHSEDTSKRENVPWY